MDTGTGYERLVRHAQLDLVPQPVLLQLAGRAISVGDEVVILEPAEMAWYLYLALRRRDRLGDAPLVAPGMVRCQKDSGRNLGFDLAILQAAFKRMGSVYRDVPIDPDDFKPRVTNINKALRKHFGGMTARRLTIVGARDRGVRDSQYGPLNLDPASIHIG